jgi:mRNA interferase YafQ
MAYKLFATHQFEKDLKRCKKRGLPMNKLKEVIKELVANGKVPLNFKPHLLHGNKDGQWECHIQHDKELTLLMLNTGTHADLFGKTKR